MRKEILNLHKQIMDNSATKEQELFRENIKKLKEMLNNTELSFFEKGWVYWQLQDHYALQRDSGKELEIFEKFVKHIKSYDKSYLFWAVWDMTQTLTMRLGGKHKLWDETFEEANTIITNSEELIRMKFEMNRGYVGIFTDERVLIEDELVENAIQNIQKIIISYPKHPDILFFRMTFYAQTIKYNHYKGNGIIDISIKLKEEVSNLNLGLTKQMINIYRDDLLFGSWDQISISHGEHYSARVGLTNVLFALCEAGSVNTIEYLLKHVDKYKLENKRLISLIGTLRSNLK
ncbi:MAG: hypothetical protein KQ78_01234 [Candidatus Izimaplasma bacterium HR2]|nr:MAG: hypothetical protein KQ78_01234 [Candidatus Izimaplasma bacterium HR2]